MADQKLRVTLVKSPIGSNQRQKATLRALGLRRMHQSVEHSNTPDVKGMIDKVIYLLKVEEVK